MSPSEKIDALDISHITKEKPSDQTRTPTISTAKTKTDKNPFTNCRKTKANVTKPVKTYNKTCLHCETSFIAKKPFSKYCKVTCKIASLKNNTSIRKHQLLKLFKKKFINENRYNKILFWSRIPAQNKKILIEKASYKEVVLKLKELGYPESMALKPFSISDDGKIMLTMNLIQKYRIEVLTFEKLSHS
jgi:hypothetical protein